MTHVRVSHVTHMYMSHMPHDDAITADLVGLGVSVRHAIYLHV